MVGLSLRPAKYIEISAIWYKRRILAVAGLIDLFVSGFTILRNVVQLDYPFEESIRSLLPLVDELVVAVGDSSDGTWEAVQRIGDPKIKPFRSRWDLSARGGRVLSQQTNLALQRCRGPWAVYLQADEVLHEDSLDLLRAALLEHLQCRTEGLLFDYHHFHGSYDWVGADWRSWYPRAFRAVKVGVGIESAGDAAGFRIRQHGRFRGLIGAHSGARIFHYGWCRQPAAMEAKQANLDRLIHGADPAAGTRRTDLPIFEQRHGHIRRFTGSHPRVMARKVAGAAWIYQPEVVVKPPGFTTALAALCGPTRRRLVRFFTPQPLKNVCWRGLDLWRSIAADVRSRT